MMSCREPRCTSADPTRDQFAFELIDSDFTLESCLFFIISFMTASNQGHETISMLSRVDDDVP